MTFVDRSGYTWELIEGLSFEVGSLVKCIGGPKPGHVITGVERILLWEPDGPIQLATANERPSIAFYQRLKEQAQSEFARMDVSDIPLQARREALEADLASATVADLVSGSEQLAELTAIKGEQAQLQIRRGRLLDVETGADKRIASLGRLGDMVPINEVTEDIRVNGS